MMMLFWDLCHSWQSRIIKWVMIRSSRAPGGDLENDASGIEMTRLHIGSVAGN
jgi:hypothetical protein